MHYFNFAQYPMSSPLNLEILLDTHEIPFAIISTSLRIVAVNSAWERTYGIDRSQIIGQSCCDNSSNCRHMRLLVDLQPYQELVSETDNNGNNRTYKVKGIPLLDKNNSVYLGESQQLLSDINIAANTGIVGQSAELKQCLFRLDVAAKSDMVVMLNGETGVGKEMAAEFVHKNSSRRDENFVAVDCTVLNEELFESELFGHEKGSFTGANNLKKGLFETANKGTLFLDEIGELPLSQQAKLLRVLETGQFRRVGGSQILKTDVRIVSATHRNLLKMVKNGQFREDLFYRLSIFPVEIPSLRNRASDIPLLVNFFLSKFGISKNQIFSITDSAMQKLTTYNWPGNIRELKNCMLLATAICDGSVITADNITFMQQVTVQDDNIVLNTAAIDNNVYNVFDTEKKYLVNLLEKHNGHRKLCADEMNISERTFYRKLKKYNIS